MHVPIPVVVTGVLCNRAQDRKSTDVTWRHQPFFELILYSFPVSGTFLEGEKTVFGRPKFKKFLGRCIFKVQNCWLNLPRDQISFQKLSCHVISCRLFHFLWGCVRSYMTSSTRTRQRSYSTKISTSLILWYQTPFSWLNILKSQRETLKE